MISKRLFLKGMKEDMRHKVWMLALSLLGSFLAMPVVWLLRYSDVDLSAINVQITAMTSREYEEAVSGSVNGMADFFGQGLMLSSGIVAVACAVLVGLEGFHYLQQKSMVDTYHSLPVSRTWLFGIKYLNGLLIWLVPCLLCTVLTLAFSGVLLAQVGGSWGIPGLILEAGKNTLVLVIAFLLVYHVMLLATMLTGNMLATLTVAVILGCGVISAYGLTLGFMSTFFRTYYARADGLAAAIYTSPLAAPVILANSRIDMSFRISDSFRTTALVCLGVALALGVLAWFSYLNRPSERAGKGLELWWIAWPLRLFVSILGGMGGGLCMHYLVSRSDTAWCVFGALLSGIMTYGVLDVIFAMDFKAFFRHRWSMGASLLIMLLICAGFQEDWMGYDRYLPDQGEIREASIACRSYACNSNLTRILDGVRITDRAQIHAFLERGIENMHGWSHKAEGIQVEEAYCGDAFAVDTFYVRVVLENGRSYYRNYFFYEWDEDVVLPLLGSGEYADGAYRLSEEQIEACTGIRLTSGVGSDGGIREVSEKEVIRELAEAYNQDLAEQPQAIILGQGRLLGQMVVRIVQQGDLSIYGINIFENMTHTLEAMNRNDIRILYQPTEAEDVESITFQVDGSRYWYRGDTAISPVERSIRGHFGVYPESLPEAYGDGTGPLPETPVGEGAEAQYEIPSADGGNSLSESMPDGAANLQAEVTYDGSTQLTEEPPTFSFTVTDPAEIARLLPLVQYSDIYRKAGVFTEGVVEDVRILDNWGVEWSVCLRKGTLPEEFIQRFLEGAGER